MPTKVRAPSKKYPIIAGYSKLFTQSLFETGTNTRCCTVKHALLLLISCLALSTLPAQPQKVLTGVHLMNLYDLNMDGHSFYADFYIWFKWKGRIDPTKIEFVNLIEKWSKDQSGFDGDSAPVKLKDGSNYKIYRIEGRFFHSFALSRFPLDEHALDIQIENPDYPLDSLVYLPDSNAAAVRQTLNMGGWDMKGCKLVSTVQDYGTDFGNPQENARRYSNLTFTAVLARPFSYFLLKMLLPLIVVMLVSIGALLLHPSYIDTRSSLPIGGMLTAVFLQQTYGDTLPDTGYMALMDKIYLLCYVLISLVMLQIIIAGNGLMKQESDQEIVRHEKRLAFLYFAIFVMGTVVLVLF